MYKKISYFLLLLVVISLASAATVSDPTTNNMYYFDMRSMNNYTGVFAMVDSGTANDTGILDSSRAFVTSETDSIDMNLSFPADNSNDYTINLWVKVGDVSNIYYYLDNTNDDTYINTGTGGNAGKILARWAGGTEAWSTNSLTTGSWQMITMVRNGSNMHLYLNATFDHTSTAGSGASSGSFMGYRQGGSFYLEGNIDEIAIYNGALTASAITQLWNNSNGYNPFVSTPPAAGSPSVTNLTLSSPIYYNSTITGLWNFTNSTSGTDNQNSTVKWWVNGALVYTENSVTSSSATLNEGNFTVNDTIIMQVDPDEIPTNAGTSVNSSSSSVGLYVSTATSHDANILHGTEVDFDLNLVLPANNNIIGFNSLIFNFNNTNNTVTYAGDFSSTSYTITASDIQMPNITSLTKNFNYTWYINVSTGESNISSIFTNTSTLSLFGVDDCSTYSIIWANFSIHDETDDSLLTGDLSAFFEYTADGYSNVYNTSETNTTQFTFCLHPDWTNETVDILTQYSSTGYESRDYIVEGYTLDNSTDHIFLYTILTTSTTDITVQVTDGSDEPLQGILIYAEKYDIGTNTYTLVESEYTDTNGEAIFQLTFNQDYYRFKLYQNGVLQTTTDRFKIFTTSYDYVIDSTGNSILQEYLTTKDAVTKTLAFDTSTNNVSLIYSESSAAISSVCLEVLDLNQSYYDTCDTTGSATLSYVVANRNQSYTGRAYYVTDEGNKYTIETISIPAINKSDVWGKNLGLAVSIIIFLTISLLGLGFGIQNKTSINAVMILSIFALFILKVFGFLPIATSSVVGMVVLAIIIMVVQNRR